MWSLLFLAATVWDFAHLPLELSDRNTTHKFFGKVWQNSGKNPSHTQKFHAPAPTNGMDALDFYAEHPFVH